MRKSYGYWYLEYDWEYMLKVSQEKGYDWDYYFDNIRLLYDSKLKKWVTEKEYTGSTYPSEFGWCKSKKPLKDI